MKSTIVGVILGLVLLAALFAAARFLPHSQAGQASVAVSSGFTGRQHIGDWMLVCAAPASPSKKRAPIPFSLSPNPAYKPNPLKALGRCRTSMLLARKGDPKKIIFAAHFRLVGQAHALTVILRFPPSGQKGQVALIRAGDKGIRVPVLSCSATLCTAAGKLDTSAESLLYRNQNAELVFPPGADKDKQVILPMPLAGLKQAISAMRQAEG